MNNLEEIPSERAQAIWRFRPDLIAAFDLGTPKGRQGLYWWYILNGFRELNLTFDPESDDITAPNAPSPGLPQRAFLPITRLMHEMWRRGFTPHLHPDRNHRTRSRGTRTVARLLRRHDQLAQKDTQEQLLSWYFTQGLLQANLGGFLTQAQVDALLADGDGCGTPRLLAMIWNEDGRGFASPSAPEFQTWCRLEGATAWPILAHPLIRIAQVPPARPSPVARAEAAFGVNLIGHPRGRFGIGEDVRAMARALTLEGIPFVIYDRGTPATIGSEENGVDAHLADDLPYAINLFCMTGLETASAIFARGKSWVRGRYNIGFWPWELPEWPELWGQAYDLVDEVWANSRFTFDAYCRSATVPVHLMPTCVAVDETEGLSRSDFGLPPGQFIFAYAFDGLSSFARKNPLACLVAFQRAFPAGDDRAALVLKGLRVAHNAEWTEIEQIAKGDRRIHLVTESMPRGSLLDLYRSVDCFVSLHRSEGFGRNIAECMLLGKPVISSAHSGNMDFTLPGTAALVPVRLRMLADGEYLLGAGQMWAEPDVASAAKLMQRMIEDEDWRRDLGMRGQQFVRQKYETEMVAPRYRQALKRVWTSMNNAKETIA